MKLTSLTIKNYRSITDAYKIKIEDYMILIGKNNEGKSNILKAIQLAFNIMKNYSQMPRIYLSRMQYDYNEDFPISLQNNRRIKIKKTVFKLEFELTDKECDEFFNRYQMHLLKDFSINIEINDRTALLTIPKRGKNPSNYARLVENVCDYISDNIFVQYIPAIRVQRDSVEVVDSLIDFELSSIKDEIYLNAKKIVDDYHRDKIEQLAEKLKKPLKEFLPNLKNVKFETRERGDYNFRRNIEILVDDGVLTSLKKKGDGVKSLFSIALLSKVESNKMRIILIDEPENHLHPDAIHYINSVISELSKNNQIIISTHNPIFVDRLKIGNNIIVENGKALPATKIDDIRKNIGVRCSDNLTYSDYIIVVEGPSDKNMLEKYLNYYPELNKLLKTNRISIRNIGGTHKLISEIYSLDRYLCNYLILLDNDSAAKEAINNLKQTINVDESKIRKFSVNGKYSAELEDLYQEIAYKDILINRGIDISSDLFKNKSLKWSDRVSAVAQSVGLDFSSIEDETKTEINNYLPPHIKEILTEKAIVLLDAICEKIIEDLKDMGLIKKSNLKY